MTTLTVILLILATARVTMLLTTDFIFESLRSKIEKRVRPKVAYLLRCDWCMSVSAGALVFLFGWYAPDTAVLIVAGALTASLFTGVLSSALSCLDSMTSALSAIAVAGDRLFVSDEEGDDDV